MNALVHQVAAVMGECWLVCACGHHEAPTEAGVRRYQSVLDAMKKHIEYANLSTADRTRAEQE